MRSNAAYPHPAMADVILCRTRDAGSDWIIRAQRLVRRRKKAHFSHVALHLNECVLHAMPGAGVDVQERTRFFLDQALVPDWRVFRHRAADASEQAGDQDWVGQVHRVAQFHLDQAYNWNFGVSRRRLWRRLTADDDSASFCSELVAKMLVALGLGAGIEGKRFNTVFPVDIEHVVTTDPVWVEVTEIYTRLLDQLRRGGSAAIESALEGEKSTMDAGWTVSRVLAHYGKQTIEAGAKLEEITMMLDARDGRHGTWRFDDATMLAIGGFSWKTRRALLRTRARLGRLRARWQRLTRRRERIR